MVDNLLPALGRFFAFSFCKEYKRLRIEISILNKNAAYAEESGKNGNNET